MADPDRRFAVASSPQEWGSSGSPLRGCSFPSRLRLVVSQQPPFCECTPMNKRIRRHAPCRCALVAFSTRRSHVIAPKIQDDSFREESKEGINLQKSDIHRVSSSDHTVQVARKATLLNANTSIHNVRAATPCSLDYAYPWWTQIWPLSDVRQPAKRK